MSFMPSWSADIFYPPQEGSEKGDGSSVSFFLCHLHPRKIGMLRFLLEGYEGLTTLTTLNASQGLVCCLVPKGQYRFLFQLLESLNAEGRIYSFILLAGGDVVPAAENKFIGGVSARGS